MRPFQQFITDGVGHAGPPLEFGKIKARHLEAVDAVIVLNTAIISDLIDDLGHHQVESRKSHNQPCQVEGCRYLEASCNVKEVIEDFAHVFFVGFKGEAMSITQEKE